MARCTITVIYVAALVPFCDEDIYWHSAPWQTTTWGKNGYASSEDTRQFKRISFSRTAHARSPFLAPGVPYCPFQCFNPKGGKRNNPISGGDGKKKLTSSIPTELPFEETQIIMWLMDLPTQRWAELVKSSTRSCFNPKGRLSRYSCTLTTWNSY
jgi:hypothetical protein